MDLQRIQKRMNYLEDEIKNIKQQPLSAPAPIVVEMPAAAPTEPLAAEREAELRAQLQAFKERLDAVEQTVTSMLDRIIGIKEKLQPSMDVTLLESRVQSLEEVTSALVGMGRS